MPRPEPGAPLASEADLPLAETLRRHWPEYAIEAGFLAAFVLCAGLLSLWALAADGFPSDPIVRRGIAGIVVGLVMIAMIYSPWGRRSGTHLNPAITLAYWRLGKIGRWDFLFYLLAQVAGALVAVLLLRRGTLLPAGLPRSLLAASLGPRDEGTAILTEFVLSATAMLLILFTSNHASWFRWTGLIYGLIVMLVVACTAPLAGFGMNVARLLAVDITGNVSALQWLNLLPPMLGMLLGVEAYRLLTGRPQVLCAKLAHNTHGRCIFRCQHPYQARALAMEAIKRRADRHD